MCYFKNWHADEYGYIVKCECCNHFQVCFGTTLLTLNDVDFEAFRGIVKYKMESHVPIHDNDTRCILIPTPCYIVHSVLSENELARLHAMLEKVDSDLKAQQLLALFAPAN
jgi:hypothetical protein